MTTEKEKETFESKFNELIEYISGEEQITILLNELKQLHDEDIKRVRGIGTDFDNKVLFPKLKDYEKQIAELKNDLVNQTDLYLEEFKNAKLWKNKYEEINILKDKQMILSNSYENQLKEIEALTLLCEGKELSKQEKDNEIYDLQEEIKYLKNTDKGKLIIEIKNLLNTQNRNIWQLNKCREEIYKLQNEVKQLKEYIEGNK